MRILVTGGSGFIGNHLCRKLLKENNSVICLDNNFTGSLDNISDLVTNNSFTFIKHDVTESFEHITNQIGQIDQIYHLACPASPKAYQYDPVHTLKTNFIGTLNILELAKLNGARVLLTSTSEIYGNPLINPQTEEYWGNVNPIGIRSCYDEGKRVAETLMIEFNSKYSVDIRIARIFNTYGPKMDRDDGRVVSNFIVQCLTNQDITIYGDGLQTRSFCYVDDTVDGLIKLMLNTKTIGPINIGNPNEITVRTLSNIIKSMCVNTKSTIIYKYLPSDDPVKRRPDITKANNFLNWKPKIELKVGLEKTIDYFRKIV